MRRACVELAPAAQARLSGGPHGRRLTTRASVASSREACVRQELQRFSGSGSAAAAAAAAGAARGRPSRAGPGVLVHAQALHSLQRGADGRSGTWTMKGAATAMAAALLLLCAQTSAGDGPPLRAEGTQGTQGTQGPQGPGGAATGSGAATSNGAAEDGAEDDESEDQSRRKAVASAKQYAANKPVEDRYHLDRLMSGAWFFSVFDGHGGWQCADYAKRNMAGTIDKEMRNFLGVTGDDFEGKLDRRKISGALRSAFEKTDRTYMVKVAGAFELGFGRDTRAGACALGALVLEDVLFVANAGDCRAVVGVNTAAIADAAAMDAMDDDDGDGDGGDGGVESWTLDDVMADAAVKDAMGAELSPELQKALRAKLFTHIHQLKKQGLLQGVDDGDGEGGEASAAAPEAPGAPGASEATEASEVSVSEPSKTSLTSKGFPKKTDEADPNMFVNVVRMLTGGQPAAGGSESGSGSSLGASSSRADGSGAGAAEELPEFSALDMSYDHNCRVDRERKKLEREHPGETDVVICRPHDPEQCYIKGKLQPTRALGDYYLKFSEFMRDPSKPTSAGRHVPPPYTPPYITATPEVMVHELRHGVDEFLILGTDGLWDVLSSQDAVNIAGEALRGPGGSPAKATDALTDEALKRAAANANLTVNQLKALKAGRARRTKHDDITVVVVDLAKLIQMHYFG